MIEKNQLTANTLNEIMFIVIYLISGLSIIQNTMTIGTISIICLRGNQLWRVVSNNFVKIEG